MAQFVAFIPSHFIQVFTGHKTQIARFVTLAARFCCCMFAGECKEFMTLYMKCLKRYGNDIGACRQQSKDYLGCRMEK